MEKRKWAYGIATHYFINDNGQRHGEYKVWFNETPGVYKPNIHCRYKDGILHGEYKSWYYKPGRNNKQLPKLHCHYKDGVLHGEYIEWIVKERNKESKLFKHCFYKNGKLDGEYKLYDDMFKQLEKHCFYKNDVLHGEFKEWDWDEGLQKHKLYEHGEMIVMFEISLSDKCIIF